MYTYQKTKTYDRLKVCYSFVRERKNKIVDVIGLRPKMLTYIYLARAINMACVAKNCIKFFKIAS